MSRIVTGIWKHPNQAPAAGVLVRFRLANGGFNATEHIIIGSVDVLTDSVGAFSATLTAAQTYRLTVEAVGVLLYQDTVYVPAGDGNITLEAVHSSTVPAAHAIEAQRALNAHLLAADPHPVYTTPTEVSSVVSAELSLYNLTPINGATYAELVASVGGLQAQLAAANAALSTAVTGLTAADVTQTTAIATLGGVVTANAAVAVAKEPGLGLPAADGYLLGSTLLGQRTWVPAPVGGGGSPTLVWLPLPFDAGWGNAGMGGREGAYAIDGSRVWLRGWIWRSSGTTTEFATMPTGAFSTTHRAYFALPTGGTAAVEVSGKLGMWSAVGTPVILDGASYWLS